jgi:hypothetical protein
VWLVAASEQRWFLAARTGRYSDWFRQKTSNQKDGLYNAAASKSITGRLDASQESTDADNHIRISSSTTSDSCFSFFSTSASLQTKLSTGGSAYSQSAGVFVLAIPIHCQAWLVVMAVRFRKTQFLENAFPINPILV